MGLPVSYSLRSLWVRRRTAAASACGIALVVFVLAASRMLATGLRETLLNAGSPRKALVIQTDTYSEENSRVRQSVLGLVAAAPGVGRSASGRPLVSGEAVAHVYLSHGADQTRLTSIQVRGVTESAFELRPEVRIVEGRRARPGTAEAIIGKGMAGRYPGMSLGSGFELQKHKKLEIVGVFDAKGTVYESEVWADLDLLRSSFGWTGYLSSITAELVSPGDFDAFAMALQVDKEQGLSAERERAYYERLSQGMSAGIEGLGGMVTFIFSFGAMLGAAITMYAAISQRRRELGVLRALGFTRGHVLMALLLESLALALIGGALGLVFALGTRFVDFSTVNWATGQEIAFRFVPSAGVLVGSLLAGTMVGVLGGLVPALKAATADVIVAMRV